MEGLTATWMSISSLNLAQRIYFGFRIARDWIISLTSMETHSLVPT